MIPIYLATILYLVHMIAVIIDLTFYHHYKQKYQISGHNIVNSIKLIFNQLNSIKFVIAWKIQ